MMLAVGPVAPIGAHPLLILLLQIGLLLGLALLLGRLARAAGMPAIVGELCAGVLLGPSLLAHVAPGFSGWLMPAAAGQMHLLDAVAQLGVLLLVGITGMTLDLKLVRRLSGTATRVSLGGLLLPLAAGVALGFALPATLLVQGGDRGVFAAFLGVVMCVSAIPVIAKTLLEMRLLHRRVGQLIVSAAAVDDIVGWLLLSVVSALATTGLRAGDLALSVGYLLLAVLLTWAVARPVAGVALKLAARSSEAGVTVGVVVVLLMLGAAGTLALGMEAIVGCFFVGIAIGASRHLDRKRLASLQTFVMAVLAPLFFATAGLRMDLSALDTVGELAAAATVLTVAVAGKFAGAYAGARSAGIGHWEGLAIGSGLNARGVIEVVIAMAGLRLGVLSTEMYTIVLVVAIVTSLMAPPTLRYAVRRMEDTSAEELEREKAFALT